jgi:protein-histidine pros-kinase
MLRYIVIIPAIRLSEIADEVSKGNLNAPELNASGSDEISTLGKSFS